MKCEYCGAEINNTDKFCSVCGAKTSFNGQEKSELVANENNVADSVDNVGENQQSKSSKMSVAGFVLGLVGMLILNFVCSLLGVIFSSIGLNAVKKGIGCKKGLAIAGLVTGIIGLVFSILNMTSCMVA
ncbi:MAG: DUF4190 domain-containing protein [Candidatus Onthoplasma sp.]